MAHAVLVARSLLFEAWFYLSMAAMGVVFFPAALVSRRAARWSMRAFCAQAFAALELICGLRCELRGKIPDRPLVIAAKHQSFLDVLMLMRWTPEPVFVMKRSLVWAPIFGLYALRIGAIPIDRRRGARALVAMEAAARRTHGQLIIYPQGTRVPPRHAAEAPAEPYRRGAARLARALDRPLLPIATNAGLFWGRASILRRPGVAVIEVLPPIAPETDETTLTRRLETVIEPASIRLAEEGETPVGAPA